MTIYHACSSSLARIVFSREHYQNKFQRVLKSKTKYEKISYFWPQSRVGISSIKGRYNVHVFLVWKGLFSLKNLTKHDFNVFKSLKISIKNFLQVWPKSWVNPFAKSPSYRLDTMHAFRVKKGSNKFQSVLKSKTW